jgi:hypothetical protein
MSSRPAMGSTPSPIQWVPGALSPSIKRPGHEADHSPPTSGKVKKTWVYSFTPPYTFMANFTFTSLLLNQILDSDREIWNYHVRGYDDYCFSEVIPFSLVDCYKHFGKVYIMVNTTTSCPTPVDSHFQTLVSLFSIWRRFINCVFLSDSCNDYWSQQFCEQ